MIVGNTRVKRGLANSEYNKRVKECMGCEHVINENERVKQAVDCLEKDDLENLGKLLNDPIIL